MARFGSEITHPEIYFYQWIQTAEAQQTIQEHLAPRGIAPRDMSLLDLFDCWIYNNDYNDYGPDRVGRFPLDSRDYLLGMVVTIDSWLRGDRMYLIPRMLELPPVPLIVDPKSGKPIRVKTLVRDEQERWAIENSKHEFPAAINHWSLEYVDQGQKLW